VRRFLIRRLLPVVFCTVPPLAAVLIFVALPEKARQFYIGHVFYPKHSPLDWLILGLGAALFCVQMLFALAGLQWRGTGFNARADRWLTNLGQAAEWFPLLGLIGTVAGIMQTFASFGESTRVSQADIIYRYAPAITATCSGLFMALINILPTWVVLMGRDIISTLGGDPPAPAATAQAEADVYQPPAMADRKVQPASGASQSHR
jgi:hypothetical protein